MTEFRPRRPIQPGRASSERQILIQIAKKCCGRSHPAAWKVEPTSTQFKRNAGSEGENGTDEAIATVLNVGTKHRVRATPGPRAETLQMKPDEVLGTSTLSMATAVRRDYAKSSGTSAKG